MGTRQARDVAAGMCETCNEAIANRIGREDHDDGNGAGRLPYGRNGCRCRWHQHVDIQLYQLGREIGKAFELSFGEALLDDEVLTLDITELPHSQQDSGVVA